MKNKVLIIFLIIVIVFITGCINEMNENEQDILPEGYRKAEVLESTNVKLTGIGAELDPHFFSQNVTRFNSAKEEDWQIVINRVKEMQLHRIRLMLLPEWLEPLNDNNDSNVINWDTLTADSIEMQSLYKVLDLAEEEEITVNLTLWGANRMVSLINSEMQNRVGSIHFLAENNNSPNWTVGAKNEEEFAENFSMYIQLLINQKGYTCIKEITPVNEPSWTYLIDSSSSFKGNFEKYASMCRTLHNRFKADGIRDKVLFNLSDDAENLSWLEKSTLYLDKADINNPDSEDIADMWNSHTYQFGYETINSNIQNWQKQCLNYTKPTGKPHIIGEFGSNQTAGSTRQLDIDNYERGVLIVRQALNFFNQGSSGVSHWTLFDQYYKKSGSYGEMMQLGFWKYKKSEYATEPYYNSIKCDYEIRPAYYSYSLLTRYIKRNADVYPIDIGDDFTVGTAFKNPDGKWVYAFANGSNETLKISLRNGENFGEFEYYVYENGNIPSGDKGIQSTNILKFVNKNMALNIKPNTVVLLNEIK